MTPSHEDAAAIALAQSRLHPDTPEELDRLTRSYPACRELADDLWREPLDDTAPLLLPIDG
jgi:hypothetical protein